MQKSGEYFGISTQGVTHAVKRVEQMGEKDKGLKEEIMRMTEAVANRDKVYCLMGDRRHHLAPIW